MLLALNSIKMSQNPSPYLRREDGTRQGNPGVCDVQTPTSASGPHSQYLLVLTLRIVLTGLIIGFCPSKTPEETSFKWEKELHKEAHEHQ